MSDKEIQYGPRVVDEYVRLYRSIIVWCNQRTGGGRFFNWMTVEHHKLTIWNDLFDVVEKAGYTVYRDDMSDTIFDPIHGIFRNVYEQYEQDKDHQKLSRAVAMILWHRPSFRIINEYTPDTLCQLIIQKANDYHYSNIFIHRRNSMNRLLSLYWAEESENWTSKNWEISELNLSKWKPEEPDEKKLGQLRDQEVKTREKNIMVWRWMGRFGCRYSSTSYEDLYRPGGDMTILHITFRWLFYNVWDFISLQEEGHIGDNKYYIKMDAYDKLEELLRHEHRPTFSNMHVEV